MFPHPSFAVVLEGGLVQSVLVQDWPPYSPLPQIAIVDYDTEDADSSEITHFAIGARQEEAVCRAETPTRYESLPDALSPKVVLAALGEAPEKAGTDSPLAIARSVRQSILELDARLNDAEQAPTGDDYNQLYVLANCGLIDVLKALGDFSDFGE
ncbi:hypothetical protein ACVSNE_00185 [Pseudomonas aeruginosa]|uniref:Uncharacterized protein n=1 Tax=Burkholderia cenocepacia TaxID=95486 RepID=A0ABD4UHI7_9BURK|nr:hypothetical protein [Burkholderia cenocepacia]MCW3660289.1 hypothetical protein [Burkholderia cenocepacia]MCW3697978.1 hypothetical protein [Burkholderia cenocepacia]MCW3705699.1 hypothetical protein [Burkholderia cenocepacia]MCW3713970.1 hypothetical protein [Burkholderia cenocepacia]MCW3722138.1 hypothetical protein [Burkholderia cenocepacia]